MQGIYYTRGVATVAAPGFPKEGGGQANSLFFGGGGGGDLVCTSHYTMQKIMDFNDWVCFFIKMKKFKEKFKNFRVWELGNTDRKLLTTQNFWPFQASC